MKFHFTVIFVVFLLPTLAGAEDHVLAKLFNQQHVNGTIVIFSLKTEQKFIHNDNRANQRFSIASTFKIMNTLIALEEKIITGKQDKFKWDGHIYKFPDWNHDQTLENAFKVSCVWCYQQLASQVSADKYRNYLQRTEYGELHEPFDHTTFWLDGSLKISAIEQVNFLKKVYLHTLPFSASSYETLRQIMLVDETPAFKMWAKTGWATRVKPEVGWYVGYIETNKDIWFFATNIEIHNEKDLPLRQKITREALYAKGIIE